MSLIYDFENEIAKYGLSTDEYEQILKECSDKQNHIVDCDWADIISKYNIKNPNGRDALMHYDSLRKSQQSIFGGAFVLEYYKWKLNKDNTYGAENVDYIKELQIQKDEIYKEKRKLYDQRREYNKLLISDARSEHLCEELIKSANKLSEEQPLEFNDVWFPANTHKEAVLSWADWHYGMVTDNIWNTYNTKICRDRVKKLIEITKEFLRLNNIDTLNILTLGDAAHGSIHTGCRVKSEEETCDQLMHVAELMAEAINELSSVVNKINLYSCYGNHLRSIQDKKESIHSDNMEKIVPWWLRERLQNNPKIEIFESEYKEFTKLNVLGKNICALHGDLEKNFKQIGVTVNTIFTKKFGETIDYTISADKHHIEEFEHLGINSILVPSLCGTDDYANNGRLYSDPAQTLMIFNDVYGRECIYHIPLN